jgi:membrane associated rhomboid family serine protease
VGSVAATLSIGIALIATAAMTFNPNGYDLAPQMQRLLALNPTDVIQHGRYYQLFSSALVHLNIVHLAGNLLLLALLSVYERRVGHARFIIVFIVSALVSSLIDLALLPAGAVSMGASGGICGLAAGFFLDHDEVTKADWVKGLAGVLMLVTFYSFAASASSDHGVVQMNWAAHIWGAMGGAFYIRFVATRPIRHTT